MDWFFTKNQSFNYAWGNPLFFAKLQDIESRKNINTVFLGSSHFYRQIDPMLFDSITKVNSIPTNSYNVGVPGLANPENYYLLENLLNQRNLSIKNLVIVLSQLQGIELDNFFKPRSTYFLNSKNLLFAIEVAWNERGSFLTKTSRIASFILNYLFNKLGLSSGKAQMMKAQEFLDSQLVASFNNGFLPLDDELSKENLDRLNEFQKDPKQLERREKNAINDFLDDSTNKNLNHSHLNRILNLLKKCEKKRVKLFFVIPPRMNDYSDVLAIQKKMPENCIIEMANPMKYPEFYNVENSFDIGHLNKQGAAIFTRILAEKFVANNKNYQPLKFKPQ